MGVQGVFGVNADINQSSRIHWGYNGVKLLKGNESDICLWWDLQLLSVKADFPLGMSQALSKGLIPSAALKHLLSFRISRDIPWLLLLKVNEK